MAASTKKKPGYIPLDQRAVDRLEIVIEGAAAKARATVGEYVRQMSTSGMRPEAIRDRLIDDLQNGGPMFADLRNFATAKVPGWTYDLTVRFAGDTLEAFRKRQEFRREREVGRLTDKANASRDAAIEQTNEILEQQGVDVTQLSENEFFEPPEAAPLDSLWRWVAVLDKNTCTTCAGNHGRVMTLGEWAETGEPRSGTCSGAERCRCVLVPEGALKGDPIPPLLRPRK